MPVLRDQVDPKLTLLSVVKDYAPVTQSPIFDSGGETNSVPTCLTMLSPDRVWIWFYGVNSRL
jgi:hypothetical protein